MDFLAAAFSATSEEESYRFQREAEMLYAYHRRVAPITRLVRNGGTILALTSRGALVRCWPVDYLAWTRANAGLIARTWRAPGAAVRQRELCLPGFVSPTTKARLGRPGWTIYENSHVRLKNGY